MFEIMDVFIQGIQSILNINARIAALRNGILCPYIRLAQMNSQFVCVLLRACVCVLII